MRQIDRILDQDGIVREHEGVIMRVVSGGDMIDSTMVERDLVEDLDVLFKVKEAVLFIIDATRWSENRVEYKVFDAVWDEINTNNNNSIRQSNRVLRIIRMKK